jgi:uncharacterized phiE125 gp8 family phage protein
MILTRTVAPASRPITLDEAKAQVRVTGADEDTLLTALIGAATDHLDGPTGILGRAILQQTWTVDLTGWSDPIFLPIEPVQSVTVTYTSTAGTTLTLSESEYDLLRCAGEAPSLRPKFGGAWPELGAARLPVRVTVVAGEATAPEDIKAAIKMLVAHWYEHREAVATGTMQDLPLAVGALLARHRRGLV